MCQFILTLGSWPLVLFSGGILHHRIKTVHAGYPLYCFKPFDQVIQVFRIVYINHYRPLKYAIITVNGDGTHVYLEIMRYHGLSLIHI